MVDLVSVEGDAAALESSEERGRVGWRQTLFEKRQNGVRE